MPGAPRGSRLPGKEKTNRKTREAIESAAFQIGLIIAIERNRAGLNQTELAEKVGKGATQSNITRIERGRPAKLTSTQITKLFKVLGLEQFRLQREFLRWWQTQKA